MDESMKQTVYQTTSEVFETMFFTFLEPLLKVPPKEEWESSADHIEALIGYKGNINGTVRFYFPVKLANHITLNFLAVEEADLNERQVIDTVGETANMAVGSLLGKIDPQGSCKLAIPQAKKISDFSPATIASDPDLFVFNTEHGLLWMIHQAT